MISTATLILTDDEISQLRDYGLDLREDLKIEDGDGNTIPAWTTIAPVNTDGSIDQRPSKHRIMLAACLSHGPLRGRVYPVLLRNASKALHQS
jgi:hypothetical protein